MTEVTGPNYTYRSDYDMSQNIGEDPAAETAWQKIKALRPGPPQELKRADLPLVYDKKGVVVGAINRAYRRSAQGRFRGVPVVTSSPKGARVTPSDPSGRSAGVVQAREVRRLAAAARKAARTAAEQDAAAS